MPKGFYRNPMELQILNRILPVDDPFELPYAWMIIDMYRLECQGAFTETQANRIEMHTEFCNGWPFWASICFDDYLQLYALEAKMLHSP